MKNLIDAVSKNQFNHEIPSFNVGDNITVSYKITEGSKTRIQSFKGLCIKKRRPNKIQSSFTVRKRTSGIGVEKTFLTNSPLIMKITVNSSGKVRRAKIYYIRDLVGKKERLKKIIKNNSSKSKK